ncbi:MAG: glycerol-3-phosphate acyltransferase [Candidatus Kapaibacteriales bacterium]
MTKSVLLWIISYLIGAVPTAFLLVKIIYRKDLSREGSGNIGARNAYDVTNSKILGIIVFLIDFLKGFFSVYLAYSYLGKDAVGILISGLCAVLGHNFSIFIKFKGGRGLATSAGILFAIQPFILIFWCVVWIIIYKYWSKNIHFSNFSTTIISPFIFYFLPFEFIQKFSIIKIESKILLFIFLSLLSILVIIKHIQPIRKHFS